MRCARNARLSRFFNHSAATVRLVTTRCPPIAVPSQRLSGGRLVMTRPRSSISRCNADDMLALWLS